MIYFVEDDINIRKLVCYALSKEGWEIRDFGEPKSFWDEMEERIPELIVLDVMLPGEDGLEMLKKIRKSSKYKDVPVIMLTAKSSEFDVVIGLDMGADDYIPKPFGMTELIARIKAVMRRYEKTKPYCEYRIGDLYVNPEKHIVEVGGDTINLAYKEYSLLMELLEADGRVISRDLLLSRIWGEFYDESRTLDVHIRKLRVKLKQAGDLIHTVKNIGYKLEE